MAMMSCEFLLNQRVYYSVHTDIYFINWNTNITIKSNNSFAFTPCLFACNDIIYTVFNCLESMIHLVMLTIFLYANMFAWCFGEINIMLALFECVL